MRRRDSPGKEIRIMVMGETGVGKSTFICAAVDVVDKDLPKPSISDEISPPPKGVEEFEAKTKLQAVVLIEAPGFNHAYKSDTQQLNAIIAWLKKMSAKKPQAEINGIIYLFDVNNKFQDGDHLMNANRVPRPPGVLFVTCKNVNSSSDAKKRRDDLKAKFPVFNDGEDHFDGTGVSAWSFINRIVSADTSISMETFQSRLQKIPLAGKPKKSLRGRLIGFFSSLFL